VRGALEVLRLLASHPLPRANANRVAAAWRGDRELNVAPGQGDAWVVAFAMEAEAKLFQRGMAALRAVQHPTSATAKVDDSTTLRLDYADGTVWEAVRRGQRVFVLTAPGAQAHRRLRDRLEGPPHISILDRNRKPVSLGDMVDRLLDADMICVGETHNADLDHQVQLQVIKALFARDERLGVGMEMFQRPFQAALDDYISGAAREEEFLKASEYAKRWGYAWALYKPIVDFCRNNRVPVAALNAPKELTSRISKAGHAGLTTDEKKQLGPIDFDHKAHRAYWYERLPKLHGQDDATAEQKERSYQVMTVWDDYMATSAARFQTERRIRRMVILAGSGHIERGFGIPDRAARRTGGSALTIKIVTDAGDDEPVTDFTIVVR